MNSKEQKRLMVLSKVERGELRVREAGTVLGLSERQVWRLRASYRREGAAALAHGNRGRRPVHALSAEVREQVVALAADPRYAGYNHSHFTEVLAAEPQGLVLSRASVRRILGAAGLRSPRRRRPPQHRSRRERMAQAGMLLQWDGSRHDWLEGRGPWLTLVGAIDDATGEPVAARFRQQEDGQGYLLVLRDVLRTQGIPLAIYRDRHGIFERREQQGWTLEEELAGERVPTQVGRALAELGIESIPAHSPQAKGRIERLWGTWQDRLVKELRLAEASTPEEADRVLQAYLPRYRHQFGVPAAQPGSAYRPLPPGLDLDTVCCFKYQRTVANDHTVSLGEHQLQLHPTPQRQSYAHARVEVHERLDGSLAVSYQGHCLTTTAAPPSAPQLRARQAKRVAPAAAVLPLSEALATSATGGVGKGVRRAESAGPQGVALSTPRPTTHAPSRSHPWRKGYDPKLLVTKSLTT